MTALLALLISGCGSTTDSSEYDEGNAPGAAYTAYGMYFRKDAPQHSEQRAFDFYYKNCAMNGDESYYSKTSYTCNGPRF